MSRASESEPYSYQGQLVFNGIYSTNILQPGADFAKVASEELNDFGRGSPEEPKDGYEPLDFADYATNSHIISDGLANNVDSVHGIRQKYEKWDIREDPEGEQRSVRDVNHYDIYWNEPNHLFVKGNKTQAKRAAELVQYTLGDFIQSREIEFDPDFLLWLFYKYHDNSPDVAEDVSIEFLSDAQIEGEREDRYGKRSRVDKSVNITKSTTVLIGILRNKKLTSIEGVFSVLNKPVQANIEVGGRVHIKASHAIEGKEKVYRMSLALSFLSELVDIFERWEQRPGEEKYPPLDFFDELYDECERQGAAPNFPYDDVIETYRQKRTQESGADIQSGLGDFD